MTSFRSKYRSKKTTYYGIEFDSKKEANRYAELILLERAGVIGDLKRQVSFELIPAQYEGARCVERACKYVADFVYTQEGKTIVEDCKGVRTDVYIIKRKLMYERYGIRIKET